MSEQAQYSDEDTKAHFACLAELNAQWMSNADAGGTEFADREYQMAKAAAVRAGRLLPEVKLPAQNGCFCKVCVQARAADEASKLEAFYGVGNQPGDLIVAQVGKELAYAVVPPNPAIFASFGCQCNSCEAQRVNERFQNPKDTLSEQLTRVTRAAGARALDKLYGKLYDDPAAKPKAAPDYDAILATRRAERERDNSYGELPPPFSMANVVTSTQAALERALSFDQHDREFSVKARLGQR